MDIQHVVVLCFLGTLCLQISQQTPTRCILGPVTGMCKAYMPRFFFNDTSKACEGFIYGGCGGNDNNFETQEECKTACILDGVDPCTLEPDTGMCRASIPRIFYNRTSGTCNQFIYGGCGGNDNNFETVEECEGQCKVPATVDPCFLKPETGMCRASIPRYFYNHTSGSCEMFTYGGCKGNENNFETVQACADKCVPSISLYFQVPEHQSFYHCFLKPEVGPCHALLPRYFYNSTLAGCQTFNYGGCQGNGNNFEELKDCTDSCTGADHCLLQPDPGTCLASLPRHFYNYTSNKCELFFYGGCGGNDNNFATSELCEAECARDGGNNYASCLRSPGPILLLSFIISVLLTTVL